MILKVFAIYDSKAEAYLQPFFTSTIGMAIRSFEQAANDPQTQFHRHPADFTLFNIGEYDDETGTLVSLVAKVSLGTALELKKGPTPVTPIFENNA